MKAKLVIISLLLLFLTACNTTCSREACFQNFCDPGYSHSCHSCDCQDPNCSDNPCLSPEDYCRIFGNVGGTTFEPYGEYQPCTASCGVLERGGAPYCAKCVSPCYK